MEQTINQLTLIPIEEISKFINSCGSIPLSIKKAGISNLNDFWYQNFDDIEVKGFPKKKAKALQATFREFSKKQLEDVLFWNRKYILPTQYNSDKRIEENLQLVLDELIDYIDGCYQRMSQISNTHNKKRIKHLQIILKGRYQEDRSHKDIAKILRFKNNDPERVRQILIDELLKPLFNSEALGYNVLKHVSISSDLIDKVADFRKRMLFNKYRITDGCSVTFFEDVLNVDILQHNPLSYIIPSREKGVYREVLKAFFDEMTAIIKPATAEDIAEIIDSNEIIQREVYGMNKTYSEDFVYQMLYDDELVQITNDGTLLDYQYIRNYGNLELGSVHQERALARVVADQNEPITNIDAIQVYYDRYGIRLPDNQNFTPIKKYGCQSIGKTHWTYSHESVTNLKEWIKQYSEEVNKPFYWDDILKALAENKIPYKSDATIRTYITRYCAVHNSKDNYFCHRDIVDIQRNPSSWRRRAQMGVLNWIANEIHLMFNRTKDDYLLYNDTVDHLIQRARASNEGLTKKVIQNNIYTILCRRDDCAPFEIEYNGRNIDKIKKRVGVYENTDWFGYGMKGRGYQRKLISLATFHIRKTQYNQLEFSVLVQKILNDIEGDIYDNVTISEGQIRKKLQDFINSNDLRHSLKLLKTNGTLYVQLDARQENEDQKYKQENNRKSSEVTKCDWEHLVALLKSELSFCKDWLQAEHIDTSYEDIVDRFADFIKKDNNKNVSEIVPQRLYEFFVVSNPTSNDRYCIMCNIAKNFEGFIETIYRRRGGRTTQKLYGIYDKAKAYGFDDYEYVLNRETSICSLSCDGWQYSLKKLNYVRNADGHGNWYIDNKATDNLSESERNIQKIIKFAALYIFTYAKYAMQ